MIQGIDKCIIEGVMKFFQIILVIAVFFQVGNILSVEFFPERSACIQGINLENNDTIDHSVLSYDEEIMLTFSSHIFGLILPLHLSFQTADQLIIDEIKCPDHQPPKFSIFF